MDQKVIKIIEQLIDQESQPDQAAFLIDEKSDLTAHLIARTTGIVSGIDIVKSIYHLINPKIKMTILKDNGSAVNRGTVIAYMQGKTQDILKGEKLALYIIQTMSGIATLTNKYKREVHSLDCQILDGGDTTLLLRGLENIAVKVGGGLSLEDREHLLIKNYHQRIHQGIKKAVDIATTKNGKTGPISVIVSNQSEFLEALTTPVTTIIFDNMTIDQINNMKLHNNGQKQLGLKANLTLAKTRSYALTGINFIVLDILNMSKKLDINLVYTKIS